jgi:hypothetical protein
MTMEHHLITLNGVMLIDQKKQIGVLVIIGIIKGDVIFLHNAENKKEYYR